MGWLDSQISKFENTGKTFARKVVDDSFRHNAENASGAGLEVRVSREYDGVGLSNGRLCYWCLSRCGVNMTLAEAESKGTFERHEGCGCIIEYVSLKRLKTYQTGKSSSADWLTEEEFQKRVSYGIGDRALTPLERVINAAIEMQMRDKKSLTLVNAIIENHEALKHYTPEGMKRRLEKAGYKALPLSKSKTGFNDLPFEKGGGYKVIFGGDGIFQYHPAGGTNKIEYWKIRNGERGIHHYDTEGREFIPGKRN